MSFQKMEENVLNISALDNKPKISAAELKAMFDAAGVSLKTFVNNLIDELAATTAATHIGADVETVTTKTLQAVLNAFESSILERYTKKQTETLVGEATNDLIKDFSIDLNTGVITITKKDGTKITFDTALEKVPAIFELIEENEIVYLKITNVDGTTSQVDVTTLFNEYEFLSGTEIAFSQATDGKTKKISANIRDNSIGKEKLKLELITELEGYVSSAKDSATAASTSETNAQTHAEGAFESATNADSNAKLAKSYAVGGTGIREDEDVDNAKFYAEQAEKAAVGGYDDSEIRKEISDNLEEAKKYTDEEIAKFDFLKIVDTLPATGLPNRFYFVPKTDTQTQDLFDEYVWINGKWEWITTKQIEVDLSIYAKLQKTTPEEYEALETYDSQTIYYWAEE